jgi:hypothetical protein
MYTKPTLLGAVIRILVLGLAWGWGVLHSAAVPKQPSRPIVAELYANPDAFIGAHIIIYGLVIQSDIGTRSFMLQDVSQHPLRIDAHDLPPIAAGEQVQLEGILERSANNLVFHAEELKRVKVLAGGGCC